jgi:ABC-type spermidine/putrescine transport system permease subunit II
MWALTLLGLAWFNVANQWYDLRAGLTISGLIAWFTMVAAVLVAPVCLLVLRGNRAPRSFAGRSGWLTKTLPQIHDEIKREHRGREQISRRF